MTIQTNATVQIKSLEFFDILGRKWSCPYEIQGNQTALIHTGGLQSGSYVAHVILQGGNEMIRFMVQH
jgi:hypothetical protein